MGCRDDRKMANGVGKHKLLVIEPSEPWSVREKLCLATSVMKSGDQNWVSVSRAIKPFAEPGRPPDWFSQKHCASKYSELLESTEAPKRKRGERGEVVETVEDVIVRRLTADRIDALKKLIKETQEKHRKLKREAELIKAGRLDSKLQELWEEILQKQKLEEEEADLKRKNTNAAYQDRQVAKNTPKRLPGVTMHTPSGCSSPSQEFSPGDAFECSTLDPGSTKNASGSSRLMTIAETCGPDNEDISHGSFLDDPTQKKALVQKTTPPPSPLLSELLKKGSILATNSRLIGDGDAGNLTGTYDLQQAPASQPIFQATEVGGMAPSLLPGRQSVSAEDKVSELSEEDVSVSYMGDELDLKTVGDIIAIIEDKAEEAAEALDAAAVEAALSLCEENGHALSGSWEAGPLQPHESQPAGPTGVPQPSSLHSSLEGKTEALEAQCGTSASLSSLCNSQDNCLPAFPMGRRRPPPTSSSYTGAPPQPEAMRQTGELVHQKRHISLDVTLKCESEKHRPEKPNGDSVLEDRPLRERHRKEMKAEDGISVLGGESASETKLYNELDEPEAGGGEESDGVEGFFSEPDGEMELEPAASESEDGYSQHTASSSLQLHTTADSIPSSPASSLFSLCSDDLEALQAHKIWKKAIMLVWRAAANHRYANVFLQPVSDEIAPGYHSIVQRPMDLAAIKKSIETGVIRTTAEFQRDIMLMFQNAVMYNSLDHDVYHMALEMQRDVLEQIQQYLATQLIMETSESGISAKSLRGRESTRKQDSADKDTVSMSSPAFLLSLFDGGTRGRRCAIEADLKMKK
ncbi:bromodomain-containing protein 8 isoform X3 [Pseudochaenichthys georgianus]|uniref:bromodomain-containing protein 8 isoform X3 n=1 Tax=Pseudochaenichthys georgianus TaxID=52239 RepID=UPI00146B5DFF|nr:bromodomain-containing protein 8 isoform X3 [Pseudochaenichthys georgianus]